MDLHFISAAFFKIWYNFTFFAIFYEVFACGMITSKFPHQNLSGHNAILNTLAMNQDGVLVSGRSCLIVFFSVTVQQLLFCVLSIQIVWYTISAVSQIHDM